jgi:molecular chaperone Hsp33
MAPISIWPHMHADRLISYYFPELGIRAAWARLEHADERLHALSHAPKQAQDWLTQCDCADSLFTSGIKLNGKLSIQLRSQGALRQIFAECSSLGYLRGIARADAEAQTPFPTEFTVACARGSAAITIEPEQGERYQGIVGLSVDGIAATFEEYFNSSEQLPTRIVLANGARNTTGFLVQRVAQVGGDQTPLDSDGWVRIENLLLTLKPEELAAISEDTLMHRLFHEESYVQTKEQTLTHHCPCSRQRVAAMLQSIGHDEAIAAANESGFAQIQCEFCNADYRFDRVDIEELFHLATVVPGTAALQ